MRWTKAGDKNHAFKNSNRAHKTLYALQLEVKAVVPHEQNKLRSDCGRGTERVAEQGEGCWKRCGGRKQTKRVTLSGTTT